MLKTCRIASGLIFLSVMLFIPSVSFAQSPRQTPSVRSDQKQATPSKTGPAVLNETASPKTIKLAFFQLEATGVESKLASVVSDMVFGDLSKLPNTSVIGSKEIDTMLGMEQKKQLAGCNDRSCMVAISGALGVDKIVIGSIGKVGTSFVISMKLLDLRGAEAKVESMFSKRVKGGSEDDFLDAIPEAMRTLFPANAALWPDPNARSGAVSANKVGPWALVGAGAAAVVVGGVINGLAMNDYKDWEKVPENDPRNQSLKDSAQTKATSAYVLYGVGAGAIAGGLIWYFVTRDAPKERKKAALDLRFDPIFIGGAAGGVISGNW